MMTDAAIRSTNPFDFIVNFSFSTISTTIIETNVKAKRRKEILIGGPYDAITFPAVQLKPQQVMLRIIPMRKRFLLAESLFVMKKGGGKIQERSTSHTRFVSKKMRSTALPYVVSLGIQLTSIG